MESGDYNQKAKIGCLNGIKPAGKVRLPLHNLTAQEAAEFAVLLK